MDGINENEESNEGLTFIILNRQNIGNNEQVNFK